MEFVKDAAITLVTNELIDILHLKNMNDVWEHNSDIIDYFHVCKINLPSAAYNKILVIVKNELYKRFYGKQP